MSPNSEIMNHHCVIEVPTEVVEHHLQHPQHPQHPQHAQHPTRPSPVKINDIKKLHPQPRPLIRPTTATSANCNTFGKHKKQQRRLSQTQSPAQTQADTHQAQKKQAAKPRKSVTFHNHVQYQEIRHLNDYTDQDIEQIWYSSTDYLIIKQMCRVTVQMMEKGEQITDNDPDFCFRGLECRTNRGGKIRMRNKLITRNAVLDEQDYQDDEDIFDEDALADISFRTTERCRMEAIFRAREDHRCVLVEEASSFHK